MTELTFTALDSDVVIYAHQQGNPLGRRILAHIESPTVRTVGSVLLTIEVLVKPLREDPDSAEVAALSRLLSRVELHPLDESTSRLALNLAASYRLRAADAGHLATAVTVGADRFLTNNRKGFPKSIKEIDIIYPEDLADLN